nr:hypothetical protein CFP56_43570 [Quercus suber]
MGEEEYLDSKLFFFGHFTSTFPLLKTHNAFTSSEYQCINFEDNVKALLDPFTTTKYQAKKTNRTTGFTIKNADGGGW